MSELLPYGESQMSRDARRAGRAISRSRSVAQIRMARLDDEADVSMAKAEAVSTATAHAMHTVTRIALAQRQLELQAPEAAARLAFLADDHMLGLSDLLADLRRQLRRQ